MKAYQLIEDKIRYNQWANMAMVDWLKEQSSFLLTKKVDSSFPSVNKAIHHIMEAETYYLSILSGVEGEYFNELPTEQIFNKLLDVDQLLIAWFLKQELDIVAKVISLKRSPYEEKYSVATIISHMVNHGTYHRGQVIAMRHQLGLLNPPKTDYYWMFTERLITNNNKFNEQSEP